MAPGWDDQKFRDYVTATGRARGLSLRQVAVKSELDPTTLNKSASRQGRPIDTILRVADALGVPWERLVEAGIGVDMDPSTKPPLMAQLAQISGAAGHLHVVVSRHPGLAEEALSLATSIEALARAAESQLSVIARQLAKAGAGPDASDGKRRHNRRANLRHSTRHTPKSED